MKIKNETMFKQIFEIEWTDLHEKMGNYFLELMGETNQEILDVLTTKIDITATGENMYCVYRDSNIIIRSEKYFSLVNTYNILRHGKINTFVDSGIKG